MLVVIKVFVSLLSIMYDTFDLFNYLFYLSSEPMSVRVDGGLSRQ